jgi:hypothetical protein
MNPLSDTDGRRKFGTWVVFSGHADLPWLRLLRPGFRHCFLVLQHADCWVMYEPLSNRTEISVIARKPDVDLIAWLRQMKFTVLPAQIQALQSKPAPWGLYTCVEAVKRVLGIRHHGLFTPWRLYRFLEEQNKNIIDIDLK